MMRTFRMVAEPPGSRDERGVHVAGFICIDIVLRGELADVRAVTPIVRAFLDVGCNLVGAWVDEGTERESVTFGVASGVIEAST